MTSMEVRDTGVSADKAICMDQRGDATCRELDDLGGANVQLYLPNAAHVIEADAMVRGESGLEEDSGAGPHPGSKYTLVTDAVGATTNYITPGPTDSRIPASFTNNAPGDMQRTGLYNLAAMVVYLGPGSGPEDWLPRPKSANPGMAMVVYGVAGNTGDGKLLNADSGLGGCACRCEAANVSSMAPATLFSEIGVAGFQMVSIEAGLHHRVFEGQLRYSRPLPRWVRSPRVVWTGGNGVRGSTPEERGAVPNGRNPLADNTRDIINEELKNSGVQLKPLRDERQPLLVPAAEAEKQRHRDRLERNAREDMLRLADATTYDNRNGGPDNPAARRAEARSRANSTLAALVTQANKELDKAKQNHPAFIGPKAPKENEEEKQPQPQPQTDGAGARGGSGTVWDKIVGTQPEVDGTPIPKSFVLALDSGDTVWIAPNAVKHAVELYTSQMNKTCPALAFVNIQAYFTSLQAALSALYKREDVVYGRMYNVDGWELILSAPRVDGGAPVVHHALYKK